MKYRQALGAFAFLVCFSVAVGQGSISRISEDDFNNLRNSDKCFFVLYFSKNCHHCKLFSRAYQELPEELNKLGLDVPATAVHAPDYRQLASREGVRGYPTMKLYCPNGFALEYRGQRNPGSIARWIQRKMTV